MKTKTGRFNYLPTKDSPEAKQDTNRFEYKDIMSKLTRDHQPAHIPQDQEQKRQTPLAHLRIQTTSPSRHIRSILLNEQIAPRTQPRLRNDAYQIIKDAHLSNEQEEDELNHSPSQTTAPQRAYPVFTASNPNREHPAPITFYQIRKQQEPQAHKRSNMAKNNRPYIDQEQPARLSPPRQPYNPENRGTTPTNHPQLAESRTNRSNKAYKAAKSQEKIVILQPETAHHQNRTPVNVTRKRSCYDYVPEEMKARLRRQAFEA